MAMPSTKQPSSIDNSLEIEKTTNSFTIEHKTTTSLQEKKKERVACSLRKERTTFSLQQALCIALLNEFCTETLIHPIKQATVTNQFFRVGTLEFSNNQVIDVYKKVKERCLQIYEEYISNGVSSKTAIRRGQNNRKIEEIHFYQSILQSFGYKFIFYKNPNKKKIHYLNTIKEVWRDGLQILNDSQVKIFSKQVHSYFSSLQSTNKETCVVEKNDKSIVKYIVQFL
ncbi:hypothetical protein EDI_216040 [Entamoeba dispar SAW760]|uniref:Uncharacterized protein n=1 Tax=Entamoeba dispar (strain ATCC PRA-260 / SAW760) TaxID=370354 RepID=B0EIM3_ENTDS|nr:uncharacterized protein EDI_216040 [Entamoeba dispar SAW760]EDR25626.1 hypothetical protein EDI_216040 [Entamoeba dispar SAW760]|eukprot:EDR25626.1 hypothetical protein EDI_216040 [Entamoeba dispar SAW760]